MGSCSCICTENAGTVTTVMKLFGKVITQSAYISGDFAITVQIHFSQREAEKKVFFLMAVRLRGGPGGGVGKGPIILDFFF